MSAVIAALARDRVAEDPEVLRRTIAGTNAIEKIVSMVVSEYAPPAGGRALDGIIAQVERVARLGAMKDAVRQFLPKKRNKNKGKKFDAAFFGRATEVFEAARKHVNRPVEILAPHEQCFLLVPGRPHEKSD